MMIDYALDNPPKAAVSAGSSDLWVCHMSPLIDDIEGLCKTLDDNGRFLRLTRGLFMKACPRALCDVGNINCEVDETVKCLAWHVGSQLLNVTLRD